MPKQRFLLPLIAIILIFVSFTSLHGIAKLIATGEQDYSLDTSGMNVHHKPPLFNLQKDGIYFIHPASEANATGTFSFKKDEELLFHFSIQKGSPVGRILFVLKKNGDDFQKFLVDTKHYTKFRTKVHKGDILTVIADPYGLTAGDWGNMKLLKFEPHYILKLRLIPFLWAMLFIYLMGKGHFYIAFNSYIGFLLTLVAENVNFGPLLFNDAMTYTIFYFLLAFLFTFIYQELRFLKRFKIATLISWIATLLIYLVPVVFIIYPLLFKQTVSWEILFTVYQTNLHEAMEFIHAFVPRLYLFATFGASLIIGYLLWRQELKERKIIERSLLILIVILFASLVSIRFMELRIPNTIYNSFKLYYSELIKFENLEKKRKAGKLKFSATKKNRGETYVVVIGESLNKNHMKLYHYFRDTTPKLGTQKSKNGLQIFDNAFANYPATMQALSFALTEANQYNHKKFFNSLSLIDICKKAGFETYWITNQPNLSKIDNIVSSVAHQTDVHVPLNTALGTANIRFYTKFHDGEIIKVLKNFKYLSNNGKQNKIIFIHLMGNHLYYEERYPKSFNKFQGDHKAYLFGKKRTLYHRSKDLSINSYDNSVYYNDYVVDQILQILQKEGGISGFLYFSDHGEDPVRGLGHFADPKIFTYEMTQIPLIAWFSPQYRKNYSNTYKTFLSNKEKLFSNDLIYDTMIGLMDINTSHYNAAYDLSTKEYIINQKNALTLHGKHHYANKDNYIYWKKANTKLLAKKSFKTKIIISDTDSVAKLNDAWRLGFRSFKLNLYYMKGKESFQTGTDKYDTQGDLPDLLKYFPKEKIEHLLLHLANLSQSNLEAALKRLEKIEKKLPLKEKITLVLDKSNLIEPFKAKGWSVALKSNKVSESVADYSVIDAKEFKQFTENNNTSGKFIINHAFNLADSKLEKKLDSLEYIGNQKIDFVLVDFKSEYKF